MQASLPARERPPNALTQMYVQGDWVTWRGHRVLWLPPELWQLHKTVAVHGLMLALSSPSCALSFVLISISRLWS